MPHLPPYHIPVNVTEKKRVGQHVGLRATRVIIYNSSVGTTTEHHSQQAIKNLPQCEFISCVMLPSIVRLRNHHVTLQHPPGPAITPNSYEIKT